MKQEKLFQVIGIVLFLMVSSQTYALISPVKNIDTSGGNLTNGISGTTPNTVANTPENSAITNIFRTITSIATGGVIAVVAIFRLRLLSIENHKKHINTRYHR